MHKILWRRSHVVTRLREIVPEIHNTLMKDKPPITLLGVMDGAMVFLHDVTTELNRYGLPMKIHTVKVKTYRGGLRMYEPEITGLDVEPGSTVLIVEDIVDSGYTLDALVTALERINCTVACIAAVVRSGSFRLPTWGCVVLKGDEYIFGYGMDDERGYGRNLRYIAVKE